MKKCPKCGLPTSEGAVICDCGYVLQTLFGAERDRVGEPEIVSSGESYDKKKKKSVSAKPIQEYERKKPGNRWEFWLGMTIVLFAFRYFMNQQSNSLPVQPAYKVSFNLTDKIPAAGVPFSSTNAQTGASSSPQSASTQSSSSSQTGCVRKNPYELTPKARAALDRLPKEERARFERLQEECREIVRKYVTPEEYDLLIKTSNRQGQNSVKAEEINGVLPLMKKIDSMTTAEEKAKLAELIKYMTRLAG